MPTCHNDTVKLLRKHDELIHMLAESLLINETLDSEEAEIVHQCYLKKRKMEGESIVKSTVRSN